MRRTLAAATIALLTTAASITWTGTAHAAGCSGGMGYRFIPGGVLGRAAVMLWMDCDIVVSSITINVRLYRYDPLAGNVPVSAATNTVANTTYAEATASTPCVPGGYWGDGDYTIVWSNGTTSSGGAAMPQTAIFSCT